VQPDVGIDAIGSFTLSEFGEVQGGTISDCLIDTEDFGTFPNLDISGLNYTMTESFYGNVILSLDLPTLVASLLAGSDKVSRLLSRQWACVCRHWEHRSELSTTKWRQAITEGWGSAPTARR
jgi:hypothetical protein